MKEDREWMRFIQELRRSSAAMPIKSKKQYTRKVRSAKVDFKSNY